MQEQFRSHLKTLGTVLGQATRSATDAAKDLSRAVATEVGGARCLQAYQLEDSQVASGGPGGLWKIYLARARKEGEGATEGGLDQGHCIHVVRGG